MIESQSRATRMKIAQRKTHKAYCKSDRALEMNSNRLIFGSMQPGNDEGSLPRRHRSKCAAAHIVSIRLSEDDRAGTRMSAVPRSEPRGIEKKSGQMTALRSCPQAPTGLESQMRQQEPAQEGERADVDTKDRCTVCERGRILKESHLQGRHLSGAASFHDATDSHRNWHPHGNHLRWQRTGPRRLKTTASGVVEGYDTQAIRESSELSAKNHPHRGDNRLYRFEIRFGN